MGIAVFIRPVIKVMTTAEFHAAAYLVPIILLAYVAEAWAEVFRFAFDVTEHTRYSTYATWIVVAVVLVLYMVLIPRYGAYGAAVATVLGFSLRALLVYLWAQHLWPIHYRWRRHLSLLALGIGVAAANWAIPDMTDPHAGGDRDAVGAGVLRDRLRDAAQRRRAGADRADGARTGVGVGDRNEGVVSRGEGRRFRP